MSTLYVIGTPIGNLGDLSARALEVLKSVEVLLCEDTRVTQKLLVSYRLNVPTKSLHEHTTPALRRTYIERLKKGACMALVTDAGTPGISDPGSVFVREAVAALGVELTVVPIPGPSALIAALSVCGFPADAFVFLGFPPHKKGRETFFKNLAKEERTVVFYESTHRIEKTLQALAAAVGDRELCVGRELTKMHETLYRGTASEILAALARTSSKGEFVLVVAPLHL